jgi:hypothetical protein
MKTSKHVALWALVLVVGILGWPSRTFVAPGPLSPKAFAKAELGVSTATAPLGNVMGRLPNSAAWESFVARHPSGVAAHIDPRSGFPASIVMSVPLIPGSGKGNTVTLTDLSMALARPVTEVSTEIVAARVGRWILDNLDVLGIDAGQLGQSQASQVTSSLWHISIPQVAGGVPVRDARLVGSL